MHTDNAFPRVYSIGQYPAQNAVSIEGGVLYLWLNGSIAGSYDLSTLPYGYLDVWLHIVVTRVVGDNILVWAGYSDNTYTQLINITDDSAIPTLGNDFYIGSENAPNTYYNGLISNFRWSSKPVYGDGIAAHYPTAPLSVESSTILLIGEGGDLTSQLTDQSGYCTITNTSCTYNSNSGIYGYDGSIQFGTVPPIDPIVPISVALPNPCTGVTPPYPTLYTSYSCYNDGIIVGCPIWSDPFGISPYSGTFGYVGGFSVYTVTSGIVTSIDPCV